MRPLRAPAALLVAAVSGLWGCSSTQTFERPYPLVEAALLQRLDTSGKDLNAGSAWARIGDRELARCLAPRGGSVLVSGFAAGQRMRLSQEERYNIGAVGRRSLKIDLRKVDDRRTRVVVRYSDRAAGFLVIPFAYANPGWKRERTIAGCLMRLEGSPREADRIAPPQPPAAPNG